jgi:hypothetical protein
VATELTSPEIVTSRPRIWGRMHRGLRQFRTDLRAPLPGQAQRSRMGRIGVRLRFLLSRHGWSLVAAVVIYYLIRDTFLYIVLPYFFARQIFG